MLNSIFWGKICYYFLIDIIHKALNIPLILQYQGEIKMISFAQNTQHVCDAVMGSESEVTQPHANGLPGIYQSARITDGNLSLRIAVSRCPTYSEFEFFARHFRDFAEEMGFPYEVEQEDNGVIVLNKRLRTSDVLPAYKFMRLHIDQQEEVDLTHLFGDRDILPEYLSRLEIRE